MHLPAPIALLLTLAGALTLLSTAAAADGVWVLQAIKTWPYAAQPNPPPPRPNRYAQDVKAQGISFRVDVTDPENRVHPHQVWMGWTISGVGNGAVVPAGQQAQIRISGRHAGDLYLNTAFLVRVGDYPRGHPSGWRNNSETYPAWGFRTDPVLALNATNAEVWGTVPVQFPRVGKSDGEPFAILFHTGIAGAVGVEYIYRWNAGPPAAPASVLPPEVTGQAATRGSASGVGAIGSVASPTANEPAVTADAITVPSATDRKAILDTLRPVVQDALGQPVEFVVDRIKFDGRWAFVVAKPQRPGGLAISWQNTVCRGDVSHLVGGLLRRDGARWSVVASALCPTDVAWEDWPRQFGAPAAIFAP